VVSTQRGDRLGGHLPEASPEDRQTTKEAHLRGVKERVTPVERGSHRLLSGGQVPSTADQQIETVVEVPQQIGERHVPGPRRGEFDSERQAVEPSADLSGEARRGRPTEIGSDRLSTLAEQHDGGRSN